MSEQQKREPCWWTCNDSEERLTHDNIDEAVEEHLDDFFIAGDDLEKAFEDLGEIEVYGYARIQHRVCDHLPDDILEHMLDRYEEALDPDGSYNDVKTDRMREAARAFAEVFIAELNKVAWACEIVETRKVNAIAWVREHAPHWLEK